MIVKIKKCLLKGDWYRDKIGEVFEVRKWGPKVLKRRVYVLSTFNQFKDDFYKSFFYAEDCEEINYEKLDVDAKIKYLMKEIGYEI